VAFAVDYLFAAVRDERVRYVWFWFLGIRRNYRRFSKKEVSHGRNRSAFATAAAI
jgi:hypothetical protein